MKISKILVENRVLLTTELTRSILGNGVDVVAEVDQIKQAVGGHLVPDRVTLLELTGGLAWIHIHRSVHILISLREHGEEVCHKVYN